MINHEQIMRRIKLFSDRLDAGINAKRSRQITAKHLDDWIFNEVDDLINPIDKRYQ
tara:strand:+ start:2559 stop:2726 length:168 start_codon:yes stop_codon:yes gene_type:complete